MFVGKDTKGNRVYASSCDTKEKYYCIRCGEELMLDNSNPCLPVFVHKNKNCDWNIKSERKEVWCKKFPLKFRDIVRYSPLGNHIVDLDIDNRLTIDFIMKEISEKQWKDRMNFYRELNNKVVVVKRINTKCISYNEDYIDMLMGRIKCEWFKNIENIKFLDNTNVELFLQFPNDYMLWVHRVNNDMEYQVIGKAILSPNEFIDIMRLMYKGVTNYSKYLINTEELSEVLQKLKYKGIPYLHKLVKYHTNCIQSRISFITSVLNGYKMVKSNKGHSKKIIYDNQIIRNNRRLEYYEEYLIKTRKYNSNEIRRLVENKSKEFDRSLEIFKKYLNSYSLQNELNYKEELKRLRWNLSILDSAYNSRNLDVALSHIITRGHLGK